MNIQPGHLFTKRIGLIEFDTLISEVHGAALVLTEYPVETGAPITDHSYRTNDTLVLTVGHSIVPFVATNFEETDKQRLVAFFEALKAALASAELFEVGTGIELYENMVITGLTTTRDKTSATILQIVITMREVQIVNVNDFDKFRQRYALFGGVFDRASRAIQQGSTATTNITGTPEETDTLKSMGATILDSFK